MVNDTNPATESRKDAPSVTIQAPGLPETRDSGAIILTPGELLTGLSVFQIDQPHQQSLVHSALAAARGAGAEAGIQSSAIFRSTGGRDVAVFTQWANRSAYEQASPTLLKPPEQDLYQTIIVDHITGQDYSDISTENGLFYFINVFEIAIGKRDEMIDYFQHTIPAVRVQPGYVSTNLLVSLDSRHAVNMGQYQTRHDFLAIFRQPRVIMAFAQGYRRQVPPTVLGFISKPPRLRLYDLMTVSLYQNTHR